MPQPTAVSISEEQSQAEILLWQLRYRAILLPLVGFAAATLKWFGVISATSVMTPRFGPRTPLLILLGMVVGYTLYQRLVSWHLRRTQRATVGVVIAVNAADIICLFVAAALVSPADHYERTLVLSMFTVLFTQMFFGWAATFIHLAMVAIGYISLVAWAKDNGAAIVPAEELWTLALFAMGLLVYVGLQGQVVARTRSLVEIFHRAQEGDFSARYDESEDQMPDPITKIGRAYNKMRADLEAIVLTDPLSGCFNRRGLNQLAEREVSRAIRGKKHIAVLAIDVDHFKKINDEFGHLTGDEVIREVGALLRETAREVDVVARIGGEEFAILAPDSNDEGALILAERVLAAFRAHQFKSLPPDRRITASVGVSAAPARDDDVAKTNLARADEALYVAKRNGRDRAERWHAGMRAFEGADGAKARNSVQGMIRITE